MYKEREILIWLNSIGVTNKSIDKLNMHFSDLREILEVKNIELIRKTGINEEYIDKILKNRKKDSLQRVFYRLHENKISTITIFDDNYPESLLNIFDKPYVLYKKGEMLQTDNLAIGIVGARKSTAYGKWACEKFAAELAHMGVTIVSGLALGIDTIAHKTAVEKGGRTLAILGNGLDHIYPKRNAGLYNEIVNHGAILSEFPLGTPPLAYNFPQRNRIISGLSLGVIVIEAKEKSGSLITAYHALEQGKDIFALPGNINSIYSQGTNKLIKDGARPLLDIEDLIEEIRELQIKVSERKKERVDNSNLSDIEIKVIKTMEEGPIHCDLISYKTGIDIATVISVLTILELKGIIKELNNQRFTLS
ncbi:DNA-protecting protein DprA [Lachnospiraceae bacterium NSJ-29]|uniref:DNA-protecting protein DprA n=2 Tax=Wansuia hejianensis TaxID=2763667 RepID=A0A926EXU5_9FIRM|nr:DNA-protecting protein DprA [Wansuia hejianensis]